MSQLRKCLTILILFSFISTKKLQAQTFDRYDGLSKESLFSLIISTEEIRDGELYYLAEYLEKKFPNTFEGKNAAALKCTLIPDSANLGLDKFKVIIRNDPNPSFALINIEYKKDLREELLASIEKCLITDTSHFMRSALLARLIEIILKEDNRKVAEDKLNYWQQKLGNNSCVFDLERGSLAYSSKEYATAEKYLTSGLLKNDIKDKPYLWNLTLNTCFENFDSYKTKSLQEKFALFKPLLAEANLRKARNTLEGNIYYSRIQEYVGDFLVDNKDSIKALTEYYSKAIAAYPSANTVYKSLHYFNSLYRDSSLQKEIENIFLKNWLAETSIFFNSTQSKEELFQKSIALAATEEKLRIRKYLADSFPNTMEGETAKAWIATQEGLPSLANKMYYDIIKKYPNPWLAIINATYTKENISEGFANFEKLLSSNPSFDDYWGIRKLHFELKALDAQTEETIYRYWERKLGNNYVFDYIKAITEDVNNDFTKADYYYNITTSFETGKRQIEVWQRWVNMYKRLSLTHSITGYQFKIITDKFITPLSTEITKCQKSDALADKVFVAGASELIGDILMDFGNYSGAYYYYTFALKGGTRSYDILKKVFDLITNSSIDLSIRYKIVRDDININKF